MIRDIASLKQNFSLFQSFFFFNKFFFFKDLSHSDTIRFIFPSWVNVRGQEEESSSYWVYDATSVSPPNSSEVSTHFVDENMTLRDSATCLWSVYIRGKIPTPAPPHHYSIKYNCLRLTVQGEFRFPVSVFGNGGGSGISAHCSRIKDTYCNSLWKWSRALQSARFLSKSQLGHPLALRTMDMFYLLKHHELISKWRHW